MFNKDRWNEIIEALNANRFRTFLTAFGVFWGITILLLLLALTTGLRTGVSVEFSNRATNSMFMWGQSTSISHKGLNKGRRVQFKTSDVNALRNGVPELKYVSPRLQLGGYRGANNVSRNEKAGAFQVYGDYPEFINQQYMDMTQGRWMNYSDINQQMKTAVIGVDVAKDLYDIGEEVIGSYIKISGVSFKVVGVFKNPSTSGDQEEDANTIFIPFTSFAKAFNTGDRVGWFSLTGKEGVSITSLKPRILEVMKSQHNIHPQDRRAIGNFDLAEQFAKFSGLFDVLKLVGYVVGGLILFSGAVGISNIMLIVVKERTNEIGVRRALGATPWTIKKQILQEALVLTLAAGLAGVAFSSGGIWLMNYLLDSSGGADNFKNPTVEVSSVFIALFILILSGVFAGLLPAWRATQMKPVDALRTE